MTAFYLKYRPQNVSQLDLDKVRDSLSEILGSKNIPHAFLFVGPKGTGKTSSARIVAKALNCTAKKKSFEPCNKCEMCQAISSGQAMDLIEIDAASNRGIDDIRDLREKIKLTPSQAKFKVYIIDEVHMLTNEAFNALLKTLEEPPSHAVFVLCTTEPQKLPGTIVSRCWQIDFAKATTEEMVRSLKKVVKGEKLTIKEDDLKKIAKRAGGSFRDGVKVLEQLVTTGKKISSKRVTELLERGMKGEGEMEEWLTWIYQGKTKEALNWLDEAVKQGLEVKEWGVEAVERLRQAWLASLGVEGKDKQIEAMEDREELRRLMEKMSQAVSQIKGAVIESLPLELAVMEFSQERSEEKRIDDEGEEKVVEIKKGEPKEMPANGSKLSQKVGKLSLKEVEERWDEVLRAMRPHNHSLEALLRATKPSGFDGKFLVLEVFYKFHKERLEVERYRQMVEKIASEVLARPVGIKYCLGEKRRAMEIKEEESDNISTEVDDDIIKTAEEVFGVKVD